MEPLILVSNQPAHLVSVVLIHVVKFQTVDYLWDKQHRREEAAMNI